MLFIDNLGRAHRQPADSPLSPRLHPIPSRIASISPLYNATEDDNGFQTLEEQVNNAEGSGGEEFSGE